MKFLYLIVSLLFAFSASAQSVKLDSDKPVEISADSLEVLQAENMAIFSGNVEAVQGNIVIKSQVMKVYYRAASEQSKAANLGAVSRIEVQRDVMFSTPDESAKATKGVYNVDKQLITLLGEVILVRGKNMLRGGRLDYNLKTQKSLLTAGNANNNVDGKVTSGGRVKGVFIPKQK